MKKQTDNNNNGTEKRICANHANMVSVENERKSE